MSGKAIRETLGFLAVVAGLVFVGIEIRQNTEAQLAQAAAQRASAYQSWVSQNMELNMAATELDLSGAMAQGSFDSANLSEDTFTMFSMWNFSMMQMAQATDYLYREGTLDSLLWETEMNRVAGHICLPGVRQFWDAGAKSQLSPGFVELIESWEVTTTTWNWNAERGFYGTPSTC